MIFMRIGVEKGGIVWYNKKDYQALSSNKRSLIILMQFKKGLICAAALTLLSGIAVMLTGCSDGRMLSDSELAAVLSKTLATRWRSPKPLME